MTQAICFACVNFIINPIKPIKMKAIELLKRVTKHDSECHVCYIYDMANMDVVSGTFDKRAEYLLTEKPFRDAFGIHVTSDCALYGAIYSETLCAPKEPENKLWFAYIIED
jgi:hypothetical protein